jgi:pimeloyl-ACP methyl ester carboxylesterase
MKFNTVTVEGLDIFYREDGAERAPKVVLLHGYPASSHQYRSLIPALARRFHVIAPDYPGFGNSAAPDPSAFAYTFDHLSEITEAFLAKVGFTRFGLYVQDYGGPVGFRVVTRRPDWLEWLIVQNSNAYEVGFTAAWDGLRHAYWKQRTPEAEKPLEAFLDPATIKQIYLHGHRRPELISPDNWNMDAAFLARPNQRRIQMDLRVAGLPAGAPAEDADLLGPGRRLLHPRGGRGVPARPAARRDASPRIRPLRRRGLRPPDRGGDDRVPFARDRLTVND